MDSNSSLRQTGYPGRVSLQEMMFGEGLTASGSQLVVVVWSKYTQVAYMLQILYRGYSINYIITISRTIIQYQLDICFFPID
jgi:hypothetical protein